LQLASEADSYRLDVKARPHEAKRNPKINEAFASWGGAKKKKSTY